MGRSTGSCGRSPHRLSRSAPARWGAAARAARRPPPSILTTASPPFFRSMRAPVSSATTVERSGSWPTSSTRAGGAVSPAGADGWAEGSSPPAPAARRSPPTAARGPPPLHAVVLGAHSTPAPPSSRCAARAPWGCSAAPRTPPPSARSPRPPTALGARPARSGAALSPRGFRAARRPRGVATRAGEASPSRFTVAICSGCSVEGP